MLTPENTLLIVIDVQGNLARVVAGSESAIQAVARLVGGMGWMEVTEPGRPVPCAFQHLAGRRRSKGYTQLRTAAIAAVRL